MNKFFLLKKNVQFPNISVNISLILIHLTFWPFDDLLTPNISLNLFHFLNFCCKKKKRLRILQYLYRFFTISEKFYNDWTNPRMSWIEDYKYQTNWRFFHQLAPKIFFSQNSFIHWKIYMKFLISDS